MPELAVAYIYMIRMKLAINEHKVTQCADEPLSQQCLGSLFLQLVVNKCDRNNTNKLTNI